MTHRWLFDDHAGETYTVPINPNKMTKLKAARPITTKVTTSVSGQTLFFEGQRGPQNFTFSGVIRTKDHYDAMDRWVYSKGRITITDHYLRVLGILLTDFDATPHRAVGVYWRHDYIISGLLFSVDATNAINP